MKSWRWRWRWLSAPKARAAAERFSLSWGCGRSLGKQENSNGRGGGGPTLKHERKNGKSQRVKYGVTRPSTPKSFLRGRPWTLDQTHHPRDRQRHGRADQGVPRPEDLGFHHLPIHLLIPLKLADPDHDEQ